MATTCNNIMLVGHLSRDPARRSTHNGTTIATFGLATNHRYKAGEAWQEETCCLDVVVFGRPATAVGASLHKGSQALVEGRVRQQTWETPEGQTRHKHAVVAERVHFLGVRTQGADAAMPPDEADEGVPDEEEIPF